MKSYAQRDAQLKATQAARGAAARRAEARRHTPTTCEDCGGTAPTSYPVCDDCLRKRLA